MENQSSGNAFQEVHRRIQLAKDRLRKGQETLAESRRKNAEIEALEKGFDRPATEPVA